jgi:uncharacterized protein involved in exopolysaccharide biosynthesis
MEDMPIRKKNTRPPLIQLRDLLTIGLRHRRLVTLSFVGLTAGVFLSLFLLPPRYKAATKILVKRERADLVVTADTSNAQQQPPAAVSETDLNSEIELMKSQDLLEKVVTACDLQKLISRSSLFAWLHLSNGSEDSNKILGAAVRNMQKSMDLELLPKTSLIAVTYEDTDPQRAAHVLDTFVNSYMEKHLAVHRPAGTLAFFREQTKQYEEGLKAAESRLSEFSQTQGTVSPGQQKSSTLQKLSEFQGELKETQAAIAETEQRIHTLEGQASTVPSRLTTQVRTADNPQLIEQLKTTLLNLELKRTELVQKFDPSYRLVQEVDTQISQTKAAITAAGSSKLLDETTDSNPTFEWVDSELAKAHSQLAAEQARAAALAGSVQAYERQASELDQKEVVQEGLMRDKTTEESNYLLYMKKQEEARISDALDESRIINVVVVEPITVPVVPSRSRPLVLILGLLAALVVSLGVAVVAEYFDPSLKTSEDIKEFLDLPVLASVSNSGR